MYTSGCVPEAGSQLAADGCRCVEKKSYEFCARDPSPCIVQYKNTQEPTLLQEPEGEYHRN